MRKALPIFGFTCTREGAWEFVTRELVGTAAVCSADRVKKSYEKIQRAIKAAKPQVERD